MKEGKIDSKFEEEKKNVEWNNRREKMKSIISRLSEKLSENPVKVYTKHEGVNPEKRAIFNKIENARIDETGSGGDVGVDFDNREYIYVGREKINTSTLFHPNADYYKITNDSFQSILTIMNELIRDSGYSKTEKTKMFQYVIDNFKNKILTEKPKE